MASPARERLCLPLGEGAPVRTLGRMRVNLAPIYPTMLVISFPVLPSSVTKIGSEEPILATASPRGSLCALRC